MQTSRDNTLIYQTALSSHNRTLKLNADSTESDKSGIAILREIGPLVVEENAPYAFVYGDLIHIRGNDSNTSRPLDLRMYWSNAAKYAIQVSALELYTNFFPLLSMQPLLSNSPVAVTHFFLSSCSVFSLVCCCFLFSPFLSYALRRSAHLTSLLLLSFNKEAIYVARFMPTMHSN
jgi:hypothetical protein